MVLIETLWNVKDLRRSIFLQGTGFNRNIVECKEKENEDLKKQTEKF